MSSGDSLIHFPAGNNIFPDWMWVAYTGGDNEPAVGDVIWGDTSDANAYLEYYIQLTGTWAGSDSAGFMLLSNWEGTAWTSGEDWTSGSSTPGDDGTFTTVPVKCFATFNTINNVPVIDFDDTVNEVAIFVGVMPEHYAGGGLTITLALAGAAATGDVSFAGMIRSFTDDVDNLLHTSFNAWGTRQDNTAIDAPSVIGELTYDDLTFTSGAQMDSLAAGEFFQLLIMRDAQDSTNDDMSGDASLVYVDIKET